MCQLIEFGSEFLESTQLIIARIIFCVPLILRLIPVLLLVYYVWGICGMSVFNTKTHSYKEGSPYQSYEGNTFESMAHAWLVLFQTMLEQGWINLIYDFAYKFGSLPRSVFYFGSFHIVTQLIVLSIIKGIVWDIFTVIDSAFNEQI